MVCKKIRVKGVVQGVGFRPFIYNLALKYDIKGWVNNDEQGVNIVVYSTVQNYEKFLVELRDNPPELSNINSIEIADEVGEYKSFKILHSENKNSKSTIISPDMSICKDCIDDINNPLNFRHNYALTNCTNCGPRYSIIKTVPYDRCNTSMSDFILCPKCEEEYKNPRNRRYHAQPVSCEECGPQVVLYDRENRNISNSIEAIKECAELINSGKILAIKGLGGFHLVCDATNNKTVKCLRERKNRPKKPFAVLFKDIKSIKKNAKLSLSEEKFLDSKEKPIVLVSKSKNSILCENIAPDIDKIGCFIAYTPLHHLLFGYLNNPIVATSANLSGEPIIRFKDEVVEKLSSVVDYILDFNREIINACDDSVVQVVNSEISILRNARGYAPTSMKLEHKSNKSILALGANQKSTISLVFDDNIILSPHIGDLDSIESVDYLQRSIETFKNFYDFLPEILVCDKHPAYESTKIAISLRDKYNIKLLQIQHHYAHLLSTLAEYNIKNRVLGFIFDGTGYGDDGNIWGGEVFLADNREYKRVNHIKYFKLLGGEKAIKEPKRVALSLLFDNYSLEELLNMDLELLKEFRKDEIKLLYAMWQKALNSPLTSSLGRVFDAIASFANLCHIQTYEGETGLLIEKYYDKSIKESYCFENCKGEIDLSPMIKQIVKDKNKNKICTKFLNTLVNIILEISKDYQDFPIVLSGGVFQNKTLLELVIDKLKDEGKEIYYSKKIPLNDGGISIGQSYFASFLNS